MQINIDVKALQGAINESATKAISDGLAGYDARRGIAKAVTQQVADGAIGEAIRRAVAELDVESLTATLADELAKGVTKMAVALIQEAFVAVSAKLRGVPEYGDQKQALEAIKRELFP